MHKLREDNRNTPQFFDHCLITRMKDYGGLNKFDDARFAEMSKNFKGGKFLDIGIGDSPAGLQLIEKFPKSKFYGLDFSPKIVEYFQKNHPEIECVVGDIHETPYGYNEFDYIIAGEVIEHTEHPDKFLKEVFRILKPGGFFSLSTPDREDLTREGAVDFTHVWSFSDEDIKELLEPFGKVETLIFTEERYPKIIGHCQKK